MRPEPAGRRTNRNFERRLTPSALSVLGALLAILQSTSTAEACSLPRPREGIAIGIGSPIPADGAVVVRLFCEMDCPAEDGIAFVVKDSSGEVIPGRVTKTRLRVNLPREPWNASVWSDSWAAWKSDSPLSVGEEYTLTYAGSGGLREGEGSARFTPESLPVAPATQWDATAHAYTDVLGESACCADGVRDSCGQLSCYFVPSGARIAVNVELEAQMTPGAAQYEYRSRDRGSDVWSDWDFQLSRTVPFDALADEYCYEVEARSLVTGEVTRVEAGCAAGRDLALPNSEEDLAAAREKEKDPFIQCTVPPEGFEEVWCKTFEEARKTGVCPSWNERACEAAIAVCPEITVVDTEEDDASELPKTPGDVLPGGSGSSATAGGGCSLTHPASGGTGLELLMMTALGVMIAGRRKKRGSAR